MTTNSPTTSGAPGTQTSSATGTPISESTSEGKPSNVPEQEVPVVATLDRLMAEIMAIPERELVPITVDVPIAVSMVLGNLPEIMKLRDQVVKSLPDFNIDMLDRLEESALALYEAQGRYLIAIKPRNELDQQIAKGTQLRDTLLSDAKALVRRGLLEQEKLGELLGTVGHRNLAVDLNLLHHAFKESWPQIEGKSAVQYEEIVEAMDISARIIRLVGLRDQGTASEAEATEVRSRIFTKFYRGYDAARRATTYLRWDDHDADKIAPSLHSARNSRKKNSGTSDGSEDDDDGLLESGSNSHNAATAAQAASTKAGSTSRIGTNGGAPPGSPESDPFMS